MLQTMTERNKHNEKHIWVQLHKILCDCIWSILPDLWKKSKTTKRMKNQDEKSFEIVAVNNKWRRKINKIKRVHKARFHTLGVGSRALARNKGIWRTETVTKSLEPKMMMI